ncbi:MAG: UPF0175 family protein [Planktothrix sp.]
MSKVTIDLPEESLIALNLNQEQMVAELRLAAAIKFYELGRLSSGAAAQLAGLPKPVFLQNFSEYGVETFNLTEAKVLEELEWA